MANKTSKSKLVSERLAVVQDRITQLEEELSDMREERDRLDITLEVLDSIGSEVSIDDSKKEQPMPPKRTAKARRKEGRRKTGRPLADIVMEYFTAEERGSVRPIEAFKALKHTDEIKTMPSVNTTMARLVKKGFLVRDENGYRLKKDEAQSATNTLSFLGNPSGDDPDVS